MLEFILLIVGLAILLCGGDLLIRGAVAIAEKLEIPPLIIGLTIVSLGTSAPELFISLNAALDGAGGLAIGNVVGSNIANVLLVLGLPAMIKPTCAEEKGVGRNILVMIGTTIVFMVLLSMGRLGLLEGLLLLTILIAFLWDQARAARQSRNNGLESYKDEVHDVPSDIRTATGLLIAGILLLPLGSWLAVENAKQIAQYMGVSDEVIGLTIVAIGTSLPELAATLMAVLRGNSMVAIGNVVGSNIFNIAAIMGVTTVVAAVPVGGTIVSYDMWIMFGAALLMAVIGYYTKRISRLGGTLMSLGYLAYIGSAFI